MRTKTEVIYDGILANHKPEHEVEYWHVIVTTEKDDFVEKIDVRMNPDTIVCQAIRDDNREDNFHTYSWSKSGHIETEATIAACKYAEWLMTHGLPQKIDD